MPCAWDRRRVHWVGNEVRLFTAPVHPGVCFSRRDGQNMCVFADTTDGQCCLGESDPCEVSLNRNIRVSFGFFFFFLCSIWAQHLTERGFIEFGICNKTGIDTCNKKTGLCLLYLNRWEEGEKKAAALVGGRGLPAVKAGARPNPEWETELLNYS